MMPAHHETTAIEPADSPLCEKVGNLIVCLHYLSTQARNDGLPEIAAEIDKAIATTAHAGRDMYMGHLQTIVTQDALCPADFINDFCHVSDETVKGDILQIVQKTNGQIFGA
ncbi:MAG TPA: hypothetical protein PLW48_05060 [Alphaproteobacteria bacterium]|nr:hypothetical protein [Alphaproteobacteria bacterium]